MGPSNWRRGRGSPSRSDHVLYPHSGAPGKLWEPSKAPGPRRPCQISSAVQNTPQMHQQQVQGPTQQPRSPPVDQQQQRQYSRQRRGSLSAAEGTKSIVGNDLTSLILQTQKLPPVKTSQPQIQQPASTPPCSQRPQPYPAKLSDDGIKLIIAARKARMDSILSDWDVTWGKASAENIPNELPGYVLNLDGMVLSEQPTPMTILNLDQEVTIRPIEPRSSSPHQQTSSPNYRPSPHTNQATYQNLEHFGAVGPPKSPSTITSADQPTPVAIANQNLLGNIKIGPLGGCLYAERVKRFSEPEPFTLTTPPTPFPCTHKTTPSPPQPPQPPKAPNSSSDADNGGVVLENSDEKDKLSEEEPNPTAALQLLRLKAKIPWLSNQRTIDGAGWRPLGEYCWDNINVGMEQAGRPGSSAHPGQP